MDSDEQFWNKNKIPPASSEGTRPINLESDENSKDSEEIFGDAEDILDNTITETENEKIMEAPLAPPPPMLFNGNIAENLEKVETKIYLILNYVGLEYENRRKTNCCFITRDW